MDMYEDFYNWWGEDWFFNKNAMRYERISQTKTKTKKSKTTSTTQNRTKIEFEEMQKSVNKFIANTRGENVILVEPHVIIKFYQMMALADNMEVYAKLIVVPEDGILTVKDALIPYQSVTSSHFWAHEDQVGKWMYELAFKEDGSRKSIEELNELAQFMRGHFHSHNSLGTTDKEITPSLNKSKPGPSGTDTEDVREHREDKPYWVEIIGTFSGFSGRIATDFPRTITQAEVKVKWWSGIGKTLEEARDHIFKQGYNYSSGYKRGVYNQTSWADRNKKDTEKKKKKKGKKKKGKTTEVTSKRDPTIQFRVDYPNGGWAYKKIANMTPEDKMIVFGDRNINKLEDIVKVQSGSLEYNSKVLEAVRKRVQMFKKAETKMATTIKERTDLYRDAMIVLAKDESSVTVEWSEHDPLMMNYVYVPLSTQYVFAQLFKSMIKDEEKLFLEIAENGSISFEIYSTENGAYRGNLLTRMKRTEGNAYKTVINMLKTNNVSDDMNEFERSDGTYFPIPRTLTFDHAVSLMAAQEMERIEEQFDDDKELQEQLEPNEGFAIIPLEGKEEETTKEGEK